jgi:predicted DCC family thiol-disulfide oxidoreductase YuxK
MSRVLLYDADCGFCTVSAEWVLRLGCDVETIPWQTWQPLASYGITPEAAAEAIHMVDGDRVLVGHEAVAAALEHSGHVLVRIVGRVTDARLLRPLAKRAYALVAANRQRLPGGTAACAMEPR